MQVILADKAGACYGVNRSLEMVKEACNKNGHVCTLGALIHNPVVVDDLRNNYSVDVIDNFDEKITADTIVIRSHGVSLDTMKKLEGLGLNVVDATCPHVKAVQKAASKLSDKYGCVVVVGKSGHPEVEGVRSYADKCYVIQSVDDIDDSLPKKFGVVSQTTQSQQTFKDIVAALESRGYEMEVVNTICAATQQRQNAALDLSFSVDAFVVLGGKNSSNTTHLAEIISANCPNTYHVETLDELKKQFVKCEKVGVTAGASTPISQIEPVVRYLESL